MSQLPRTWGRQHRPLTRQSTGAKCFSTLQGQVLSFMFFQGKPFKKVWNDFLSVFIRKREHDMALATVVIINNVSCHHVHFYIFNTDTRTHVKHKDGHCGVNRKTCHQGRHQLPPAMEALQQRLFHKRNTAPSTARMSGHDTTGPREASQRHQLDGLSARHRQTNGPGFRDWLKDNGGVTTHSKAEQFHDTSSYRC